MADDGIKLLADHMLSLYQPSAAIEVAREIVDQAACSGRADAEEWRKLLVWLEEGVHQLACMAEEDHCSSVSTFATAMPGSLY
jgi:hypothetical protein